MKITQYFLSMAAALGMIAGCQKPEMVQMLPMEDVVAPVLAEVAPIEITAENLGLESASFSWTAADYGVQTQINYAIEVSSASHADKVVVTSGISDTTFVKVPYEALNAIFLYDLELASGVAEDVQFVVSAKVGESPKVYSNVVTVSASATEAEKVYPTLTVAGSYAYNNWTPGKGQFVFDFDGDDTKYSGIIDFGEDVSALNFKFVGASWGNNEFSVPSGEAQAAEAAELPLVAGGGDNISAYTTHRYYSLTLDKKTPKVIKNFSFNTLGVIGDATPTGWDSDTDMAFNPAKQRFYVDITLVDGTIKFRANDAWDVNWGGADGVLASGADNIPVAAGNYRIYVNLNNPAELTYELSAKMYGQPEESGNTEPEPEPEQPTATGWALIGDFNGWGGDLAMTQSGVIWSAKEVELKAGEGWKLRKDAGWDVNVGATGDVEPFEVPVGEKFAVTGGGKNMTVPADGKYDVYFDEGNNVICVVEAGADAPKFDLTWFLVGGFNGWTVGDMAYKMTKGTEYYEFKGFTLEADNEVKFNAGSWDINRGGSFSANAALEAKDGGDNFKVPAGKYDVYMDLKAEKIYFMSEGKTPADAGEAVVTYVDASKVLVGLSGKFGGTEYWTDPADERKAAFVSKEVTDEATFAGNYVYGIEGFAFSNGDQFKVRVNGEWIGVSGAEVEGLEVAGSDNFEVNEGGTFDIKISFDWDGLKPSNVKAVCTKK